MKGFVHRFISYRVLALIRKEFNQIRRDRRLAFSLIIPPTVQLVLFGFALSARVTNLRLGVVDDCKCPESRELIATMSESKSFRLVGYYFSVDKLGEGINRGELDAGLAIPYDYSRDLQRGKETTVQILLNAMNANTAAIGQGYAEGVINSYNRTLAIGRVAASPNTVGARSEDRRGQVVLHSAFLYNPGLEDSWFIVTGVFGLLLILNSSLVASGAIARTWLGLRGMDRIVPPMKMY